MQGTRTCLLLATLLLSLAGCSQLKFFTGTTDIKFRDSELMYDVADARIQMRTAADCCRSLADLPYKPIQPGTDGYYRVTNDSPHFSFPDGKSRFLAFALPDDPTPLTLELRSLAVDSVFAPTVLILDENHQVIRRVSENAFRYIPAHWFNRDSIDTFIVLNPARDRYLVVYTSEWQQVSETVLQHPSKTDARSRGVVPPAIADPIARHAPVGTLYLGLEEGTISRLARWIEVGAIGYTWTSRRQGPPPPDDVVESFALQDTPVYTPVPQPSDASAAGNGDNAMLDAIRQAVADGRYDQALWLQEQAEQEGIDEARQVLLEALKAKQ